MSVSRLNLDCSVAEAKRSLLKSLHQQYRNRRLNAHTRLHPSLRRALDDCESKESDLRVKTAGYRQNIDALQAKQQDYQRRLVEYNGTTDAVDLAEELVQFNKRLGSLRQELAELTERRLAFNRLPPDSQLAQLELERLRQQHVHSIHLYART
jgi:predicted  nucleic acid-binding Zn-ribbon protein